MSGSALKIATWNVTSLVEDGKSENVLKEMERMKLDILGVSDTQWRKLSNFLTRNGKHKEYHSSSGELIALSLLSEWIKKWKICDWICTYIRKGYDAS